MQVVTGATGFLGAHLVMSLLQKGFNVRALKRQSSDLSEFNDIARYRLGGNSQLLENIEWVDAELTDIYSLDKAFENADYVYHCAAVVAFKGKDSNMMKVNSEGTANVVNAALNAKVRKLVYASSTAALGRTDSENLIDENTQWAEDDNNTEYAVSKHLAELEVWRGMEEGLDVLIFNPGIILGAGKWDKGSCRLFYNVKNGFKFYTQGVNGFIGVEDLVRAMVEFGMGDIKNKRFLMVAENLSYQNLFNSIAAQLGVKAPSIEIKPAYLPWLKLPIAIYSKLKSSASVSPETLKTSIKKHRYGNSAILSTGFKFTPIEQVIADTVKNM